MRVEFGKYEGAANDFVIIDNRAGIIYPSVPLVASLCDRRTGIGADGLMLLEGSTRGDFRMRYFNSDGREATMCGNGGRCIALFAFHARAAGETMSFEAADGMHGAKILSVADNTASVSLGMKDAGGIEELAGGYFIDTGSPHYVTFMEDLDRLDVYSRGRRMRDMEEFVSRGGANFNFVQIVSEGTLRVRTYERGVEDETFACGTGAVASAVVASAVRCPGRSRFEVRALGGNLYVDFAYSDGLYRDVLLTGPARRVYSGIFDTENF